MLLLVLMALTLGARGASGLVIYRFGTPFSAAEKDSLEAVGVDFREMSWSASQLEKDLELESLQAESLQPIFFDATANIAAGALSRNGFVSVFLFASENTNIGQVLIDGDPNTSYTWSAIDPDTFANNSFGWGEKQPETVTFDLGGEFRITEVRFRPPAAHPERYAEHYRIGISPEYRTQGRGSGTGSALFEPILEVKENREPEVRAILDPPVVTRFLQLQIPRVTPKEIGIAEVEIFGGGFVSRASYESKVIELDDIASWGEISWSGQLDPDARIDIRTRAGLDPQPDIFWESRAEQQDSVKFLQGGGDLSQKDYINQYDRLRDFLKPSKLRDRASFDAENWSFWSSSYPFENPGVDVVSPGPRSFFQIRADFSSTIEDGGKIDYIEFKASVPPAVRRLLGEIFPIETRVGEPTHFTYYVRPTIRSGDSSFDGLEISTPSRVLSVDSLRMDGIDQVGFSWNAHGDGLGFEVLLPRKLEPTDSGALVEVVFNTLVLREVGTVFEGKIFDTSKPNEVRQRVTPGNAADEIESDVLTVTTTLSESLVFSPRISPNPFTPNGDGVNDVVNISYKLLRLTAAVPVSIQIFDLSGRLVKRVYSGDDPLGEYSHRWNGTDGSNNLVPPGLYLYRIVVDVQSGRETNSGILSVAY